MLQNNPKYCHPRSFIPRILKFYVDTKIVFNKWQYLYLILWDSRYLDILSKSKWNVIVVSFLLTPVSVWGRCTRTWRRTRGRSWTSSATCWRSPSSCSMGCGTCLSTVTSSGRQGYFNVNVIFSYRNNYWQAYFGRTFDIYTKLWKFQQQHRPVLDRWQLQQQQQLWQELFILICRKYGLKRWQIGEIASKIGQLYYHY